MIRKTCALALFVLAACGGDSVGVDNVSPNGSVGGIIVDAETRVGIEAIEIHLLAGGEVFEPQMTDADGAFQFVKVPAGDVIVTIKEGETHNGATVRGTVPSAAGDFPLGNGTLTLGPLGLIPIGSTFTFRVLDESGAPVSGYGVGVETQVQYVDYTSGIADGEGQVFHQVQTDPDGYATVTGVPNYFALGTVSDAVTVFLPPRDGDADGILEFPGGDVTFNVRSLDPTPDIILDGNLATSLVVRASTIPALASSGAGAPAVVQPSSDVHVTFNLPIQSTVDVAITDEQGSAVPVPVSALNIRDDTLKIALGGLGLEFGSEYNISVHAVAAVGDRFVIGDFPASFFTVAMDTSVSVVGVSRDPANQRVTVTFNEPIGFGNVGTNSSLSGSNCVVFIDFDINNSLSVGDSNGELGYSSCTNISFDSNEWDPPGLPVRSGYSTRWQFTAPTQAGTGSPIPVGQPVHLLFDRVPSFGSVTERVDGRPVENGLFSMP